MSYCGDYLWGFVTAWGSLSWWLYVLLFVAVPVVVRVAVGAAEMPDSVLVFCSSLPFLMLALDVYEARQLRGLEEDSVDEGRE